MPFPATLPLWKTVPIAQGAEWAPRPYWTGVENLAANGIQSPDHPAHSESLYWLHCPVLLTQCNIFVCFGALCSFCRTPVQSEICIDLMISYHIQWTLELWPAWHMNNLGCDQNFGFDLRPKSWVTTRMLVKAKTCICLCGCKQRPKMRSCQSEPRYAYLWK
jgi:hypothetical protein